MLKADHDFISTYGLQIIAGRGFDRERPADSTGMVLNESAVKQFGFASAEAAIGQKIWVETLEKQPNEVIGVIRDYHQQSLQQDFTPFILFMDPGLNWIPADYVSIKVDASHMRDKVAALKQTWNRYFPESSFDFFSSTTSITGNTSRKCISVVISWSFLRWPSLLPAWVVGLTAYSNGPPYQRDRHPQSAGASVQNILLLLSWDVVKLILLCSLAAIPAAFILIKQWLNGYAFRVSISWWQFALPVVTLVIIALVTTASLTINAALSPTNAVIAG